MIIMEDVTNCDILMISSRVKENIKSSGNLSMFLHSRLEVYQKYTDLFDIDEVPEEERKLVARQVADSVLAAMECGQPAGTTKAAARCMGCAE